MTGLSPEPVPDALGLDRSLLDTELSLPLPRRDFVALLRASVNGVELHALPTRSEVDLAEVRRLLTAAIERLAMIDGRVMT